jgi:hypothetical protein
MKQPRATFIAVIPSEVEESRCETQGSAAGSFDSAQDDVIDQS